MSSTCSQASADSASGSSEPECVPSRSAKSTPTAAQSSQSTGQASPAMTTFAALQQADWLETELGESTSFAEATPVSHSATPGSAAARQTIATSGRKCVELLAKSDPLSSLLKMLLVTSAWDSTKCSLTWKPTATPAGRLLFRLQPSMPPTSGSGSGSWLATPTATANQLCPSMQKHKGCREIWPTPTARDYRSDSASPEWTAARQADTRGKTLPFAAGGMLNPEWVEWLMGYPAGWTELEPSEMPSSRRSRKSSGEQS